MNTNKQLLVILFMIVFAIFLFTVSNKKRNIIIENIPWEKKAAKKSTSQAASQTTDEENQIGELENDIKENCETDYNNLLEEKNNLLEEKTRLERQCSTDILDLNGKISHLYGIRDERDSLKRFNDQCETSLENCYENNKSLSNSITEKKNTIYKIHQVNSDLQVKYNTCNEDYNKLYGENELLTQENEDLNIKLRTAEAVTTKTSK